MSCWAACWRVLGVQEWARPRGVGCAHALLVQLSTVQAIIEDIGIKQKLYRELGSIVKPSGVLASNTSSFEIGFMSEASGRPDKLVGMHFFNPVQLMKLVEVIRTPLTSTEAFDIAFRFGKVRTHVVWRCCCSAKLWHVATLMRYVWVCRRWARRLWSARTHQASS